MTIAYGMAVLTLRLLCVLTCYALLQKLDWRKFFSTRNYYYAQYVCLLVSIGLGHLIGSFIITIMDLLRDILYSLFL